MAFWILPWLVRGNHDCEVFAMTDQFTGRIPQVKDAAATDAIRAPHGPIICETRPSTVAELDVIHDRHALLEEMLRCAKQKSYQYKEHVNDLDRGMTGDQAGVEIALETFRVWQAMACRACPLEET